MTGDIYTYDYANTLYISLDEIEHDTAEDLQRFWRSQYQNWLKVTTPGWTSQTHTNSLMLYIEWKTGQYWYSDINSEDKPDKLGPSSLRNQLIISLKSQEPISRQEIPPLDPPPVGYEP